KTAATAKLLAKEQKKHSRKKCNLDPETAFTCGMLHNIGEVLVNMHKYEACLKIQAAIKNGEDKNQAEMAELGFSYAEIAAELIRRWRLPEEICLAIVNQDSPDKDTSCNAIHYSEIIYAAKNIVIQQNNPALAEQLDEIFSHKLSPLMIEHSKSLLQHVDVKTLGQEFELLL
ncbi:MAG: HDOD domain-containing protein, partial [Pseudomonadales bacterium]|nr:HDOD domain-containing protein [Pseudomonadales bacterium]